MCDVSFSYVYLLKWDVTDGPMYKQKLRRRTGGKWVLMLCSYFQCTYTDMKWFQFSFWHIIMWEI